jgi:MmyB-like transcription regulator ligand binding domain
VNPLEWRAHLLHRLRLQIDNSGDPVLIALLDELAGYPVRSGTRPSTGPDGIAVPLRLVDPESGETLSFLSTTTVFGTPLDITLSELALECFYPADQATREALRRQD